jgi:hypothetical protein
MKILKRLMLGVPTVLLWWVALSVIYVFTFFGGSKRDRKQIAEVMRNVFVDMILKEP